MWTSNMWQADTKWLAERFVDYFKLRPEATQYNIKDYVFSQTSINVSQISREKIM